MTPQVFWMLELIAERHGSSMAGVFEDLVLQRCIEMGLEVIDNDVAKRLLRSRKAANERARRLEQESRPIPSQHVTLGGPR